MSIQMLFGFMAVLFVLLLVFETVVFWHARNVFDEAAAEGARVAAAFDGTCGQGVTASRVWLARHAGRWASQVQVTCSAGSTITVTVVGRTPGLLGGSPGMVARAVETAPKER